MAIKDQLKPMNRRKFLKNSTAFTASTVLLSFGGNSLLANPSSLYIMRDLPKVKLVNGVDMPMVGFGTNTLRGAEGARFVSEAISVGYRLIDTATIYGNEEAVGKGIKSSKINRKELFVTSKIWVDDFGYDSAKKAFETSLNKLDLDYLDLYLLHRPRGDVKGTWKAIEEIYQKGRIKAIGISNFNKEQIDELMGYAKIQPAVNQIESHVFFQQDEALEYLKEYKIHMEAWYPFSAGRNGVFENEILAQIGEKYSKTNAQV